MTSTLTPFIGASIVIPDDDTTFAPTRGIYVGVTGNISLQLFDNSEVLFPNVPVGIHHFSVVKIKASGTTATGLMLLY